MIYNILDCGSEKVLFFWSMHWTYDTNCTKTSQIHQRECIFNQNCCPLLLRGIDGQWIGLLFWGKQNYLFKVFICFSSCPWISPGIWCKSTPHTNTFVWPCGHQRCVISLILEDNLMCLRDSPLYRENPDSDFSQPSNIFNHFLFLFFPRDRENSPDVVRYQIYSVRIPKGRVELYKKKRYFRPYQNPVTKKLNNKVLWTMGHRTCKNNKKGRLCSRTHTAGKNAFSVQMPKMIVFLPFDLCESNFADLPGQGARPTERNWEGQNYRGLCCW